MRGKATLEPIQTPTAAGIATSRDREMTAMPPADCEEASLRSICTSKAAQGDCGHDQGQSQNDQNASSPLGLQGAEPLLAAGDDSTSLGAKALDIQRLKERMELEMGLWQEGTRAILFLVFCACFFMSMHLMIQPQMRNDSVYRLITGLGVSAADDASSKHQVFKAVTSISAKARTFFPMSSDYIVEEHGQTIISQPRHFPQGPVLLPADRMPDLPIQWSITARVRVEPEEGDPRKIIVQEVTEATGGAKSICWGLYTEGMGKYVLQFGQHNLDTGFKAASVEFEPAAMRKLNTTRVNLVALMVNLTHFSVLLQDGDSHASDGIGRRDIQLPDAVIPSQCSGATIEIGDRGLELADMRLHYQNINSAQFADIKAAGQTLDSIAMGIRPPTPPMTLENAATVSRGQTPEDSATKRIMQLIKASASISATEGASVSEPSATLPPPYTAEQLQEADIPLGPGATWSTDIQGDSSARQYWEAQGEDPVALLQVSVEEDILRWHRTAADGMTSAFNSLRETGRPSFTAGWWAKKTASGEIFSLLLSREEDLKKMPQAFLSGKDDIVFIELLTVMNKASKGQWELTVNNGTGLGRECAEYPDLCNPGPSVWCQAPAGQLGRWSHTAIRFGYGTLDDGKTSELEIFVDGESLCGVKFPALPEASMHMRDASGLVLNVLLMDDASLPTWNLNNLLQLKDVRVYGESLDRKVIKRLGTDPSKLDCVDLRFNQDSANFTSSFSQTCMDIALMRSSQDSLTAACSIPGAAASCVVACAGEKSCWDGVAGLYRPSPANYKAARGDMNAELYPAEWLDTQGQVWHTLWPSIEILGKASLIVAAGAPEPRTLLWDEEANSLCEDAATATQSGVVSADEVGIAKTLASKVCAADDSRQDTDALQQVREHTRHSGFKDMLLPLGQSATIVFWAKPVDGDLQSVGLTGLDDNRNVCFTISGTQAAAFPLNWAFHFEAFHEDLSFPHVSVPAAGEDKAFLDQGWAFFALSFDQDAGTFTYMVNSAHDVDRDLEPYVGCNSLKYVLFTGNNVAFSPLRISGKALAVGSLQKLRLESFHGFSDLQGPRISLADRMQPIVFSRKPFNVGIVALSPPLLLQTRANSSATSTSGGHVPDNSCSEDMIMLSIHKGLERIEAQKCSPPFTCDTGASTPTKMLCTEDKDPSHGSVFFGREVTLYQGRKVFPEFSWILENPSVVRSGEEKNPVDDYIDLKTLSLTLLLSFFTVGSRIATIVEVAFDLSSVRVKSGITYRQVRIWTEEDYSEWLGWTIAAAVAIFLFGLRTIPSALEEIKSTWRSIKCKLARVEPSLEAEGREPQHAPLGVRDRQRSRGILNYATSRAVRLVLPERYTADTGQPDMLDVCLSVVLLSFLVFCIVFQQRKLNRAPGVFGSMADINWSDKDKSFAEKVSSFLDQLTNVMNIVAGEEFMMNFAFWLLIICAVRIIIFMSLHPHIAGICKTFEVVGLELVNFLFSFGIIFVFLAFLAYVRFGYKYDGFKTLQDAMITQFAILIGDEVPDYRNDAMMCIYVIGYIFICTLAMLNFFLAIVVNGYTKVSEAGIENQVAVSLTRDMGSSFCDELLWSLNKSWPSKPKMLNIFSAEFGFSKGGIAGKRAVTAEDLKDILCKYGTNISMQEVQRIHQHYCRLPALVFSKNTLDHSATMRP